MKRKDGRAPDRMRKIKITRPFSKFAEGSCLVECGETRVICTATIEENVPPFLKGQGRGWVTAEYGMLPRSCGTRVPRNKSSGRTYEIQRLIGRSLRSVVDMDKFGERTIKVDCDVIQADGGTRTTSITGGFLALADAFQVLKNETLMLDLPLTAYVAAVSVGQVDGAMLLDLDFEEDSRADVDMNVVMLSSGKLVEVQGTAEREPFSKNQMDHMLRLAQKGIEEIVAAQKKILGLDLPCGS